IWQHHNSLAAGGVVLFCCGRRRLSSACLPAFLDPPGRFRFHQIGQPIIPRYLWPLEQQLFTAAANQWLTSLSGLAEKSMAAYRQYVKALRPYVQRWVIAWSPIST